jgi:acyl-CoA thioesterase-1
MAPAAEDEGGMVMNEGSERAGHTVRRYGAPSPRFNSLSLRLSGAFAALCLSFLLSATATAAPTRILAFGDSLFAGYGLSSDADNIPSRLEALLKADGHDVVVINAGVSGDTTTDGVARLDWSLADKPDLVLLELGSNDALRGQDPAMTRANLDTLLSRLKAANVPVVLIGMMAPRNLGAEYAAKFEPIYPDLAKQYGVPLYPFILDGVALDPNLNQADGMHPNKDGALIVAKRLLPVVEKALPAKAAAN